MERRPLDGVQLRIRFKHQQESRRANRALEHWTKAFEPQNYCAYLPQGQPGRLALLMETTSDSLIVVASACAEGVCRGHGAGRAAVRPQTSRFRAQKKSRRLSKASVFGVVTSQKNLSTRGGGRRLGQLAGGATRLGAGRIPRL